MRRSLATLSVALLLAQPALAQSTGGGGGGGSAPGGTPGQSQYNNGGILGGYTVSGDCVLVAATGIMTCFNTPATVAKGGTGLGTTPANGQILIGNGSGYTLGTLTAGANVTITNSSGSITIAASGGSSTGCVPLGAQGQVLIDSGAGACSDVTATNHDLLIGAGTGGSGITSVTPSVAGYVATSNGTGSDPSFQPNLGLPPKIANNWYLPDSSSLLAVSAAMLANTISCEEFTEYVPITVKAMGGRLVGVSSGNNVQLAIYANAPSTGTPTGNPVGVTGNISTTTAGALSATPTGGNFTLAPGAWWACVNSSAAVPTFIGDHVSSVHTGSAIGAATEANLSSNTGLAVSELNATQTFGTWAAGGTYSWAQIFPGVTNTPVIFMEEN